MVNNGSYTQQVNHNSTTINNTTTSSKTFTFFPMICRLSLSDVVSKPIKLTDLSSSSSSSPDPSSPKISCIGQIKRRSTTATTNYHHTSTRLAGKSANYTKLRKLFSGKNLISPLIETSTIRNHNRNRSCSRICNGDVTKLIDTKKEINIVISIEDLDPPLPVVKIINRADDRFNVNLGQRRGIELKTLQIQPFQLSTAHS
ncbi:uncharacterized protein [Rutidosis leptorrhynchoides]|uniref:uncharacterized protein n=1 Tax=Rutidosis leptorrhynchoides TaxID=125765 RepID=UPI003A9A4F89